MEILDRWQSLLDEIEVIDVREKSKIFSKYQLLEFEAKTGILLPYGYKEFCQVFGAGIFGSFVRIRCPNKETSDRDIVDFKNALELQERFYGREKIQPILDLFDSGFVFGGSSREEILLWDLRTYSESDRSYDIYLAHLGSTKVFQVGRNFFEFIRGFCMGVTTFEILPQKLWPHPQELHLTFTR